MAPRIGEVTHIAPLMVIVLRRYGIELTEDELRALNDAPQSAPVAPITHVAPDLPIQHPAER